MDMRGYQQYKQQSINSMTSGELLLLLYDELVKRSTLASMALEKEDWPLFEGSVERCVDIISYLDETLDRQYPISQDLSILPTSWDGSRSAATRRSWSACAPCWPICGTPSTPRRRPAPRRQLSSGEDEDTA